MHMHMRVHTHVPHIWRFAARVLARSRAGARGPVAVAAARGCEAAGAVFVGRQAGSHGHRRGEHGQVPWLGVERLNLKLRVRGTGVFSLGCWFQGFWVRCLSYLDIPTYLKLLPPLSIR